jgi:hypothetical protein
MATVDWKSLAPAALLAEIKAGGRIVYYSYCVSVGFLTVTRGTQPRLIQAGRSKVIAGLHWSALTFLAGWWGIPWGPIRTIQTLTTNMRGGHDITDKVVDALL